VSVLTTHGAASTTASNNNKKGVDTVSSASNKLNNMENGVDKKENSTASTTTTTNEKGISTWVNVRSVGYIKSQLYREEWQPLNNLHWGKVAIVVDDLCVCNWCKFGSGYRGDALHGVKRQCACNIFMEFVSYNKETRKKIKKFLRQWKNTILSVLLIQGILQVTEVENPITLLSKVKYYQVAPIPVNTSGESPEQEKERLLAKNVQSQRTAGTESPKILFCDSR
jgi:hypothetical protein